MSYENIHTETPTAKAPAAIRPELVTAKGAQPRIQFKLSVGSPDDPMEREADRMADTVMRMPEPSPPEGSPDEGAMSDGNPRASAGNFLQRKCQHCEEEESKRPHLQEPFIQRSLKVVDDKPPGLLPSDIANTIPKAQMITNFTPIIQNLCPSFTIDPAGTVIPVANPAPAASALATGAHPLGCCGLNILVNGVNDWKIETSQLQGPHTSFSDFSFVLPPPGSDLTFGDFTSAGTRVTINDTVVAGHEIIGHGAQQELGIHNKGDEDRESFNHHDPTIRVQNILAHEQGLPASQDRGLAASGVHRGESFASVVIGQFAFNSSSVPALPASEQEKIRLMASFIKANNEWVDIIGHSDPVGSPAARQQVSDNRAQAVKQSLLSTGVTGKMTKDLPTYKYNDRRRFTRVAGVSDTQPPATGADQDVNWRRVEIFAVNHPAGAEVPPADLPALRSATPGDNLPAELGSADACHRLLANSAFPVIQPKLQMKSAGRTPPVSDDISQSIGSSRGSGASLDNSTRSFMSERFGADFSGVKIHTGSDSSRMNQELNARAFTTGSDIFFNEGQYQPGSDSGKHLLAHELTHTIQQKGNTPGSIQRDLALPQAGPASPPKTLSTTEKTSAATFNAGFTFSRDELIYLTDVLGIRSTDQDLKKLQEQLADGIAGYQAHYAQPIDGKLNYMTAQFLIKEIKMEAEAKGGKMKKEAKGVLAKLSAKYSAPVFYLGFNSYDEEVKKIKANLPPGNAGQLTTVTGGTTPDAVPVGGTTFDLTKDSEVDKFVASLGIPDKKRNDDIIAFLKGIGTTNRDEMALLINAYNLAERSPADLMTRFIISGHSGGHAVFGGASSMVFTDFVTLKGFFPKAAAQVQHLMVSACSAGTQDNIEDIFVKAFPNLRTLWGYYGACPLTGGPHIIEWLKETSGADVHKLTAGGGSGVSIWNEGVYQGDKSLTKTEAMDRVNGSEALYLQYLDGTKESSSPDAGELFEYFNSVRRLLGRTDLDKAEKTKYTARREQAVRLRFYRSIAKQFMTQQQALLNEAYGKNTPDFGSLSRKDTLAKITSFDKDAVGPDPKKLAAKAALENCLRDLSPSCIPESWLQH